ncbi:MAG: hypothetical protein U1F46_08155 [Marinagarivorans sp.]
MELNDRFKNTQKVYGELTGSLLESVPATDDFCAAAIKIHLIFERLLLKIIEDIAENPEHLHKAKLSFAQLISIAQLLLSKPDKELFALMSQLNKIRNKLAHVIDESEAKGLAKDLVAKCRVIDDSNSETPASLVELLVCSSLMMLGRLESHAVHDLLWKDKSLTNSYSRQAAKHER